jgi:Ca2+-binding RTX toxin-like protein
MRRTPLPLAVLAASALVVSTAAPAPAASVTVAGGAITVAVAPTDPATVVNVYASYNSLIDAYRFETTHRGVDSTISGCEDDASSSDGVLCTVAMPTSYAVTGGASAEDIRLLHVPKAGDPAPAARIDAGAGNDVVHVAGVVATVSGGEGDDVISPDAAYGSPITDRVPGTVVSGGPGIDTLDLDNAGTCGAAPVVITLNDLADDGCAGEGDNYASDFEVVLGNTATERIEGTERGDTIDGGGGGDTILGLGGDDVLAVGGGFSTLTATIDGGDGNDTITGSPGDDRLVGGAGKDVISGGAGNDTIDLRDGRPGDRADCGDGADVALVDRGDVHVNCEQVRVAPAAPKVKGTKLVARQGKVAIRLSCAKGPACRGSVVVRTTLKKKQVVALKGAYSLKGGTTKVVSLRLRGKARAHLAGPGRKVTGTMELTPKGGVPATTRVTVRSRGR